MDRETWKKQHNLTEEEAVAKENRCRQRAKEMYELASALDKFGLLEEEE